MKYRDDINALRAIAVAMVVFFHFGFPSHSGGFIGVDVFFVISGYLMTRIIVTGLETGHFSYFGFLGARAARIWPALAVLTLVLLVLGALALPPVDYEELGRQVRAAVIFDSNRLFHDGQGYFLNGPDERWLLHTWSLSVEWQFYMAYPLLLWAACEGVKRAGYGSPQRYLRTTAEVTVWILFISSLGYCIYKTGQSPKTAFFMLPSRAWEMVAGGIVFFAEMRMPSVLTRWGRTLRFIALLVLVFTLLAARKWGWESRWPGVLAFCPVFASMLFLLAGPFQGGAIEQWIKWRSVQAIGRWSYSVYLWHYPVVVGIHVYSGSEIKSNIVKIVGVLISVLLGWISFRFVERAWKGAPTGNAGWHRVVGFPAIMLVAGLLLASGVIYTDGWVQRAGDDRGIYRMYTMASKARFYPEYCENYQIRANDAKVCTLNPLESDQRVLVYGDSQAQHLYPWFEKYAKARIDFLTSSGCPPIPHHNRTTPGYFCEEFADLFFSVASSSTYKTIIISGRWTAMDDAYPGICRSSHGSCLDSDKKEARTMALDESEREWRELLSKGKTVVIVDGTPDVPFNVPRTLARHKFWGLQSAGIRIEYPSSSRRYIDELLERFRTEPRVHRVSLWKSICTENVCSIVDAATGYPVFRDTNHFTPDWIQHHGDIFSQFVQPRPAAPILVGGTFPPEQSKLNDYGPKRTLLQ